MQQHSSGGAPPRQSTPTEPPLPSRRKPRSRRRHVPSHAAAVTLISIAVAAVAAAGSLATGELWYADVERWYAYVVPGLLALALVLAGVATWMWQRQVDARTQVLRGEVADLTDRVVPTLETEHRDLVNQHQALLAERDRLAEQCSRLAARKNELTSERSVAAGRVRSIFVNLSMRTLTLVERQLHLIGRLEHGEEDADRLQDLFRLDHLATRMRRNSENLLVLADADAGLGGRTPAPLLEVARAAISEIERYERVDVGYLPGRHVVGRATDDISHLVAELLENATAYSSPESRVTMSGWALENGEVVLSVEDEGIGVPADKLAELNQQILATGEDESADTGGMGLYVVSRLARRHGVRVQLRSRSQGGTSALVVLPVGLLQGVGPTPVEISQQREQERSRTLRQPMVGVGATAPATPTARALAAPAATGAPAAMTARPAGLGAGAPPPAVPAPAVAAAANPAAGPTPAAVAPSAGSRLGRTSTGLPKRIRHTEAASPAAARPAAEPADRTSAEELRRRLSGFQQGLLSARQNTDEPVTEAAPGMSGQEPDGRELDRQEPDRREPDGRELDRQEPGGQEPGTGSS